MSIPNNRYTVTGIQNAAMAVMSALRAGYSGPIDDASFLDVAQTIRNFDPEKDTGVVLDSVSKIGELCARHGFKVVNRNGVLTAEMVETVTLKLDVRTVGMEFLEQTVPVLAEVMREREAQDEEWGGQENDDRNGPSDWRAFITKQVHIAHGTPENYRDAMVKIAALAIAAIESHDRVNTPSYSDIPCPHCGTLLPQYADPQFCASK